MRRAIRLGLFIGTIIGMSACATVEESARPSETGAYGSVDVGRTW
jgi:hypothetical protein